jgi:hypothetical protein
LALDGGGWSPPRPDRFNPRERDPVPTVQEAQWASLNSCGKSRLDRDSIPGSSRPQRAAILATLSRLLWKRCWNLRFRNKKKTKLSLSMSWRHTGGAYVQLRSFVTSTLQEGNLVRFTPWSLHHWS